MPKETTKVGEIVTVTHGKALRPAIVTSVNGDGTVNVRVIDEPADNPTRNGDYSTFVPNVKL